MMSRPPRTRGGRSRTGERIGVSASNDNVQLSKSLSWILRHGATQEGIQMSDDGFVDLKVLLQHPRFSNVTLEDIQKVVETNDKKRFAIREDPVAGFQIRANQGHSLEVKELALIPIQDGCQYPCVIHGTYLKYWNSIRRSGLSRMNRVHIHLAPGVPGESGVISGMRSSAEVLIYVDLQQAIKDGIPFFTSENNVILTPGNENGFLLPKYFTKVVNRQTQQIM